MNKTQLICSLFVLLVWNIPGMQNLWSQVPYDSFHKSEAIKINEQLTLFTDRDMYAVNEQIFFRAVCSSNWPAGWQTSSKVLYLELVTPLGKTLAQGKYHLDITGSSGYLTIPPEVLTGNYYLRTYTRWMRNFGPLTYAYLPLKIINPFMGEVLTESNGNQSGYSELSVLNSPLLKCQPNKEIYAPGEEILLEILPSRVGLDLSGEYCLTVVPSGLIDTKYNHHSGFQPHEPAEFRFKFLPDIYGVSVSGRVLNTNDQSPAPDIRLHFSCLDGKTDYFAALTDEHGRFILTIPERRGIQELFVVSETSGDHTQEILIDQDFASAAVPFYPKPFTLTTEEREAATRMVLNMQLKKAFGPQETRSINGQESDSLFRFYGKPEIVVIIDKYIKLPTMEEVFLNLVPKVFILYRRGEPYLRIESLNPSIALFPPLVLVDNIPIFDLKSLLRVDPTKIERIEVVNEVYTKGDLKYGGIISITSKKKDMAAVDLPEGSYFFDYQTFYPGDSRKIPPGIQKYGLDSGLDSGLDYELNSGQQSSNETDRIPDFRNTVKWIDRISLGPEGKMSLHFPASSNPGAYHILVRGRTHQGEIIQGLGRIRVEEK